jgi:DNA-binding transcriptional LysR family regulator
MAATHPPQLPRRLNLNHLPVFLAVADSGSFRAAAARLHVSQSALSVQVRQLEEVFGVPLFHRTTRSVSLTGQGERLLPVVRRLAGDIAQVTIELREEAQLQRGVTTVAVLPSLGAALMPRILREFAALHPGVQVRLRDADSKTAFDLVRRGEVDMGLLCGADDLQELAFIPLLEDELMAVVPAAGHALSARQRVTLQELSSFPLLLNPRGVALREMLETRLRAVGVVPAPAQELVGTHALVALVGAGTGVSILPRLALATADVRGCRVLKLRDGGTRQVGLLLPSRRSRSPATEALKSFIERLLRPAAQRR